jgi:hypothetical protein
MGTKNEKLYDDEIAPLLLKAAKLCKKAGIPMVAAVWFDNNDTSGLTHVPPADTHAPYNLTYAAWASRGNIDLMCMALARQKNHTSVVLQMLGGMHRGE